MSSFRRPIVYLAAAASALALLTLIAWHKGAPVAAFSPQPAGGVPPAAIAANNIGVAYMNQYLYTEAAAAFEKAVAAASNFDLARVNLGIALLYKQDYDEALRVLQEAAAREPKNPYAHYALGLLFKNKGENEKATEHFARVTQIDPKDAAAFYHLGVLQARSRKIEEAELSLRRCLELEPLNTSAMYNLGALLLKSGRTEEGNRLLEQFRALQQKGEAGGGMGIGNQYGEMGAYALAADYRPAFKPAALTPRPPETMAPFADVPVDAAPGGQAEVGGAGTTIPLTQGVALADLDGDGNIDAVVTRYEPGRKNLRASLYRNEGKGMFIDITDSAGVPRAGSTGAALGDYDNDGLPDIYLPGSGELFRNLGKGKFQETTEAITPAGGISATFLDYDHDGDLDLYVCSRDGNRMFRNNGNGSFTDVTDILGVAGSKSASIAMVPSDMDNDRDIDLVLLHLNAPAEIFSNERNDRFKNVSERAGINAAGSPASITVSDLNRDGAMDLFASPVAGKNVLMLNKGDGSFQLDTRSTELLQADARFGSAAFDFDNDGDLDLCLFGQTTASLWENAGDGSFVFAGRLPVKAASRAAIADFDGDGRVDILYLDSNGGLHLLRNEFKSSRHWIGVQLEGLRSNKMGLGAKVEVRAGALYQKFEIQGQNGHLAQDSPVVWLGLGDSAKADTITVRWPSGILQSEINPAVDRIVRVKELDRKGTSCPLLYTWNGEAFEFVTDFLGGCAIGYLEAPGQYSIPDTDEYVRIEGSQLVPRDGKYLLNLNNQLEEVIMFDQAQLLVVDHPAGTEVYPNERLMPSPPFPEFKIHVVAKAWTPRWAIDDTGKDVTALIGRKDREYPQNFRSLPFKGYAETHSLTMDLGSLNEAKKILLLMDAWIDYADSSSNLAAGQAGVSLIPPYLQVKDSEGTWVTAIPSMGFPAGLPKTMTVDLTGKFLTNDYRVRIVTNMKIYWDRIRVDATPDRPVQVTRLEPQSADLHFRGYPAYFTPDGKLPWIYDYNRIKTVELWGTHTGAYTRYGDVRELLLKKDDRFVMTRHGDEITLAFDALKVPPPEKGMKRDYLFFADGFGKDMDLNSLYPEVMGPLPFHGMSKFPYPASERYPDDDEHRGYQRRYNTRVFPVPRGHRQMTSDE